MATMKKILYKTFPRLGRYYNILFRELLHDERSYLQATGWMRSLKEDKPVAQNGDPLPWMNYPMIEFLEERLQKDHTLFEYGSGFSTLFYAERVGSVVSLEYSKKWVEILQKQVPSNVELLHVEKDEDGKYCRAIQTTEKKFDIVFIDGRDRVNCLKQCLDNLSERGVILFDDSHRERYQEGLQFALEKGFKQLHFQGLKPTGYKHYRTTLFYKPHNCFNL